MDDLNVVISKSITYIKKIVDVLEFVASLVHTQKV